LDLTQLAQLGEFIGGVGVFATLIYLTIQVRQSNSIQSKSAQLARANANENAARGWSVFRKMLTDPELSSIWRKAHADEEISPDEKVRLHYVVAELTYTGLAARDQYAAADAKDYEGVAQAVLALEIGTSATMREAWSGMTEELKAYGLEQFAKEVSNLLKPQD
jgi:hypothetical protein